MIAVEPETETAVGCIYGEDCPLHAENPPFNAKALAAIEEGNAIFRHEIPANWYHSLEEALKDLGVQPVLDFSFTNQFKKDLKLMERRHRDMDAIYDIIALLIWDKPLPERCREHNLHGNYEGLIDCHVENDWIMLYRKSEKEIVFYFTGTHSDYL